MATQVTPQVTHMIDTLVDHEFNNGNISEIIQWALYHLRTRYNALSDEEIQRRYLNLTGEDKTW